MRATTKKRNISFADVGSGGGRGESRSFAGFCSVDLEDDEAEDVLGALGTRPDEITALPLMHLPEERKAVRDILARIEGRFLAGVCGMRGASAADDPAGSDVIRLALWEHMKAWGRRRRLIDVTADVGDDAVRGFDEPVGRDALHPSRRHVGDEGFWDGWRLAGTVRSTPGHPGPASRLARIVARAAMALASHLGEAGFDEIALSLRRHRLGEYMPFEPFDQDLQERRLFTVHDRDVDWGMACGYDSHANDARRLSGLIMGRTARDHRDRLLLKLLGSGICVGSATGLRLPRLDVDAEHTLHGSVDDGSAPDVVLAMDGTDAVDLWGLVRGSETLDGFLFARIGDGTSYGRVALDVREVDGIVAGRMAEFDIAPGRRKRRLEAAMP